MRGTNSASQCGVLLSLPLSWAASCLGMLCNPEGGLSHVWLSLLLGLVWAKSRKNVSIMGSLALGIENSEDRLLVE